MLEVFHNDYDDLSGEEKEVVPDNGHGKEYAGYVRIKYNGVTIRLESDAMEPEDANFARDLNWIYEALRKCYELGRLDAQKTQKKITI